MLDPVVPLVARFAPSAGDARRGVVRLHPEVLDNLGLHSWDAVTLTGARVTTALAAPAAAGVPPRQATMDDVTLSNAGLTDGATVVVTPGPRRARPARSCSAARALARAGLTPETARLALLGKVVTSGDAVSLLPQDVEPVPELDVATARRRLAGAVGGAWTTELLTVAATEPAGAVAVVPSTVIGWQGDGAWGSQQGATGVQRAAGWHCWRHGRSVAPRHAGPLRIRRGRAEPATAGASGSQQGGPAAIGWRRATAGIPRRRGVGTPHRPPSPSSTSTSSSATPTPRGASSSGSS